MSRRWLRGAEGFGQRRSSVARVATRRGAKASPPLPDLVSLVRKAGAAFVACLYVSQTAIEAMKIQQFLRADPKVLAHKTR